MKNTRNMTRSEITILIFASLLIAGCALQLKADAAEMDNTLKEAYAHCYRLEDSELAQYAFEAGQSVDGGEIDDCAYAVKAEWEADARYFGGLK